MISKLINENNNEQIKGVEFTKNGVLVTKNDGVAEYWSVDYASQDSELRQEVKGYHGIIASAHPLDPYFIYGVSNNSWGMYNMETGLRLCEIPVEEEANLTSITVHPDGLMMATG